MRVKLSNISEKEYFVEIMAKYSHNKFKNYEKIKEV